MRIKYSFLKETKTCVRFEHRSGEDLETLYLKKTTLADAGIDPAKGIVVTIEEAR